jgi:hypothetical protein
MKYAQGQRRAAAATRGHDVMIVDDFILGV